MKTTMIFSLGFAVGVWSADTCTCDSPFFGQNGYTCSNGINGHCAYWEQCYNSGDWEYGNWAQGCRSISCKCDDPNGGSPAHSGPSANNKIVCETEGFSYVRYCSYTQGCTRSEPFRFGDWSDGCEELPYTSGADTDCEKCVFGSLFGECNCRRRLASGESLRTNPELRSTKTANLKHRLGKLDA